MAAILGANGLSRLLTAEMRGAISDMMCEILVTLTPRHLLGPVCKPQRNQLISVLLGEIGLSYDLQVKDKSCGCNVVENTSSLLYLTLYSIYTFICLYRSIKKKNT